jgi:hypothetical protein
MLGAFCGGTVAMGARSATYEVALASGADASNFPAFQSSRCSVSHSKFLNTELFLESVISRMTMAINRKFRVIIGGGGISGLTLANALEKADIDYVLLESRDTITPQVGASIGLFPNGIRIIDQLGCFDVIEKQTVPLGNYYSRYANGDIIYVDEGSRLTHTRYVTLKPLS